MYFNILSSHMAFEDFIYVCNIERIIFIRGNQK